MFKGEATLEVNESTLIEAMQEYLDQRLDSSHQRYVNAVKLKTSNGYVQEPLTYTVSLQETNPMKPDRTKQSAPQAVVE